MVSLLLLCKRALHIIPYNAMIMVVSDDDDDDDDDSTDEDDGHDLCCAWSSALRKVVQN